MSSIRMKEILKSGEKTKTTKLTGKSVESFIKETKAKQDFILSLKQIDEKSLRAVVQL